MEETLKLDLLSEDGTMIVSFTPADSVIADSLVDFLKKSTGERVEIVFAGKAEKSKFLQIAHAAKVALTGFSFHELDPETLADPEITFLLNRFEKQAKEINADIKEYGFIGAGAHRIAVLADMKQELNKKKEKMSPKQLKQFQTILSRYETEF